MSAPDIKPLIGLAADRPLSRAEAEAAFEALFEGAATPSQMGGFLMALRSRGETVEEIAAAALGNGIVPAHNVTTEFRDTTVVAADARRARREFGYLRMWSIHPNQILPIIAAMQPDFTEVEEAAEILIAAQDTTWGPIQHAGRLHDRASYRYYWELLQRAHATGIALPVDLTDRFFS